MTAALHVAAAVLAIAAAVLALLSAVGVLAMRDAYQKLHFVAPPATLSSFVIVVAVALSGAGAQASLKALLVAILLTAANGVLGHATARALFVRDHGHWPPRADEAGMKRPDPEARA